MKSRAFFHWLDDNILFVLSSFLLAFIPLYPKIPLVIAGHMVEVLPGYIVRVRLEDFFILLTGVTWLVQLIRKKITFNSPLTFAVLLYAAAGLLSTISGVIITQTIPPQLLHIGKSMLHFFRYMEYFSLMFIAYAGITSIKQLKVLLAIITSTVVLITFYGFGQRFWYWPVYSTMNREFSKGVRLVLTEHARVQSTFGGHYDLAAYLVLVIPLLLTSFYLLKNRWLKIALFVVFIGANWLMIATASRTSYAALFLAFALVVPCTATIVRDTVQKRIWWTLGQYTFLGLISVIMLAAFGSSMYERLVQTIEAYPAIYKPYSQTVQAGVDTKNYLVDALVPKKSQQAVANTVASITNVAPPENALSIEDAAVMVSSDTQPSPAVPNDVFVNVPTYETVATVSADGTVTQVTIEKERTYTDTAQVYGLSMAIRLDTLWPRAIAGFYKNPLLGSGYATLTKETTYQFTEAESTDNNFLRTLGETGLLGFITFYGTVGLAFYLAFSLYKKSNLDPVAYAFVIAFMGGTVGLLLNAGFIDVFAASKVALTYWAFAGIILAIQTLYNPRYFSFDFLQRLMPSAVKSKPKLSTAQKRKKK